MESFRPYTSKFNEAMSNLSGGSNTDSFPLMENREIKTVEIVVITSDRGLCGSFNSNIIKFAEKKTRQYESEGKQVSYVCVGKKGKQILRKTGKVRKTYDDIMSSFQMFNAREIASDVSENFLTVVPIKLKSFLVNSNQLQFKPLPRRVSPGPAVGAQEKARKSRKFPVNIFMNRRPKKSWMSFSRSISMS